MLHERDPTRYGKCAFTWPVTICNWHCIYHVIWTEEKKNTCNKCLDNSNLRFNRSRRSIRTLNVVKRVYAVKAFIAILNQLTLKSTDKFLSMLFQAETFYIIWFLFRLLCRFGWSNSCYHTILTYRIIGFRQSIHGFIWIQL